ncbi:hypothetical protein CLU83_4640 [Flavobacterium sp. 1]|uniref:hypothetical protein n=1 Tax=Flavobacterium sp. 1 TaxID=2035200 RepID=UPI000C2345CB|nr:hypothetical protein [Flavobacterium sp. 1]PJJ11144.1 hypothetical protein CLU83_4640 [Flavobacterium sp. 1]
MKNNETYINRLIGLKIVKGYRFFYESFLDEMPEDLRDQETDGSLCLLFSDNTVLEIKPISENFSIDIEKRDINYIKNNQDLKNVSNNSFWSQLVNIKISSVKLLENGIQIGFENLKKIEIKYLSETEYTFDSLIIRFSKPDDSDMSTQR